MDLFVKDNLHESDNLWFQICYLRQRIEALEIKVKALESASKSDTMSPEPKEAS